MKIALINGSPKFEESASGTLLEGVRTLLPHDMKSISMHFSADYTKPIEYTPLLDCSVFVIAFPLYVDGVPSHLVRRLAQLQDFFALNQEKAASITVYAIANCGFYEGNQNEIALQIIRNWCHKSGLKYGYGIGVGGGGMIGTLGNVPVGKGPRVNEGRVMKKLVKQIQSPSSHPENEFFSPNMPGFLYKFCTHIYWRKKLRKNGLRNKDLFRQK